MKKFKVEKVGAFCERLGTLEVQNHVSIQSPGIWLTTSSCGVPHLTPETLEMAGGNLQHLFAGLLVSYERHARSIDVYQEYKKGFNAFSGLAKAPVLLTIKVRNGGLWNVKVSKAYNL